MRRKPTERHLGRVSVSYSLLENLLGLPDGAIIDRTFDSDQFRAIELVVEGHSELPLVAPGEEIPLVDLEMSREVVDARFVTSAGG